MNGPLKDDSDGTRSVNTRGSIGPNTCKCPSASSTRAGKIKAGEGSLPSENDGWYDRGPATKWMNDNTHGQKGRGNHASTHGRPECMTSLALSTFRANVTSDEICSIRSSNRARIAVNTDGSKCLADRRYRGANRDTSHEKTRRASPDDLVKVVRLSDGGDEVASVTTSWRETTTTTNRCNGTPVKSPATYRARKGNVCSYLPAGQAPIKNGDTANRASNVRTKCRGRRPSVDKTPKWINPSRRIPTRQARRGNTGPRRPNTTDKNIGQDGRVDGDGCSTGTRASVTDLVLTASVTGPTNGEACSHEGSQVDSHRSVRLDDPGCHQITGTADVPPSTSTTVIIGVVWTPSGPYCATLMTSSGEICLHPYFSVVFINPLNIRQSV